MSGLGHQVERGSLAEAVGAKGILSTQPDVLTPVEAAKVLRLGRTTMYGLLREEKIRSFRVGRKVLIPRRCLEEFVDRAAELNYNGVSQMVGNPSRCEKGETT